MNEFSRKIRAVLARKQRTAANGKSVSGKKVLLYTLIGAVGLFVAGVIFLTIVIAILSVGLPDVHDIDRLSVAQSTTIFDRDGNVLYVKHGDENRKYISYDKISMNLVNATAAIEDDGFWDHKGFDLPAIVKAGLYEVFGIGTKRGGSTITQQYVKNAFLSSEHSYTRKIKELILAVRLEQAYDKEKIMELYLNKIPYGNTAYGIQKAAEVYFDKDAKDLDVAESSILAALPQAPSTYNPYGPNRNSEMVTSLEKLEKSKIYESSHLTKGVDYTMGLLGKSYQYSDGQGIYIPGRSDLVLRKLYDDGYITEDQKTEAWQKLQKIEFNDYKVTMEAPHFVFYVIQALEEKYGKEVVEQGGLQVYTTIDPELQEIAEQAIKDGVASNARFNATNASLVSIDPKTGQILAMVGSVDYYDEEIDGNVNIATSYKQPGSSFKPYVYAQSFYNGYAPASVLYDVRTQFGGGTPPNNYDGAFLGPMSIRRALPQSRNITAIKAFFLAGGQEPIIDLTERMGLHFLNKDVDYGWPLALGTAEVRLLDHTSAFGVFANGGKKIAPIAIMKVENSQGDILEEFDEGKQGEEVLDPQVAYLINSVLSDLGTRLGPSMTVSGQVNAAKTGTSNKKANGVNVPSNLWTMGYTTHLSTGVWAGNSDDRKSGNLSLHANGYEGAAPIWKDFMTQAHSVKGYTYQEFPRPPGIQDITVSAATGKLPGANVPPEGLRSDVFASFGVPTEIDNLFAKVKIDKRNDLLANDFCPPEFVEERTYRQHHSIDPSNAKWEQAVQAWAAGMIARATEAGETVGIPPSEVSPLCNKEHFDATRSIKITDPSNYTKVDPGKLEIKVKAKSTFDIAKVTFYFDGNLQNTIYDKPYTGEIRISRFIEEGSVHTVKAVLHDVHGYTVQSSIEIRLNGDGVDDTEDVLIDTDIEGPDDSDPASPEIEIVNTDGII